MLEPHDLPQPREILQGWHVLKAGPALTGDKFWRPMDRVWLPMTAGDAKHGVDVRGDGMPVVIRKG